MIYDSKHPPFIFIIPISIIYSATLNPKRSKSPKPSFIKTLIYIMETPHYQKFRNES